MYIHTLVLAGLASLVTSHVVNRQVSTDGRCGTGFGTICEQSECCSSAGWCGNGYLYCSAPSCQIDYGPSCDANVRPNGPDTANVPRPRVGSIPYGQELYRCERNGAIALTYDDGPYSYTEDLLDLLASYNARATFFVTGRNLGKGAINDPSTAWPGLIRRMIQDGHQIASHTWSHQRLTTLSRPMFLNQMLYLETALSDLLGYFPTYMRPPYSASNATTDGWLGDLGYHVTYFNLDTEGYLHDSAELIQDSKNIWDVNVEGRNPATTRYLQIEHDPVYQSVYNLTGYMLESMVRNGFQAVTVGECLRDPPENWYRTPGAAPPTTSTTSQGTSPTFPPTTDGRCGTGFATSCGNEPDDRCCSSHGWCGDSVDHCGTGCQVGYGDCSVGGSSNPSTQRSSTTTRRASSSTSSSRTSTPSSTSLPLSTDGHCGPRFGGTTCIREPGATCCSQYGWCGASTSHCGTGCQSTYGTCGTSN